MGKLLDENKFWDLYWDFEKYDYDTRVLISENKKKQPGGAAKTNALGDKISEYVVRCYHDYFLWDIIYKRHLPRTDGARILEVGSAPGTNLVRLARTFGYVPYGVEYSERGVDINKKVFRNNGYDEAGVISADFFSDEFQDRYKGFFDIVVSRGFLEDFFDADVEKMIGQHTNLLAKGGHLVISVPNLNGIYYIWALLFDKKLLSELNRRITDKTIFSRLFRNKGLSVIFCDYYGTFNCGGRFSTARGYWMKYFIKLLDGAQYLLNILMRLVLRSRGMETPLFSPYLLFIGIKK